MKGFLRGVKMGLPIGLGYLSVSFTFGIMAVNLGFSWWQAVIVSMANLTSAGQLAGIQIMGNFGSVLELFISQLTINIRYSFMSVSLTQKTDKSFNTLKKLFLGFFMTDEIFAVASMEKNKVSPAFFGGLTVLPYICWSLGTLLGSLLGSVLPTFVTNALGLAIYGMFIAIISPAVKEEKPIRTGVLTAAVLNCVFTFLPLLKTVPSGISISICAVFSALLCAFLFPLKEEESNA